MNANFIFECSCFCFIYMKILLCRFSIISTGGTASSLITAGVNVTKVEEITYFPEMVSLTHV